MTEFLLSVPPQRTIHQPPCPDCGRPMMLTRVDPDTPDHDKRTFGCLACDREESVVVKFR